MLPVLTTVVKIISYFSFFFIKIYNIGFCHKHKNLLIKVFLTVLFLGKWPFSFLFFFFQKDFLFKFFFKKVFFFGFPPPLFQKSYNYPINYTKIIRNYTKLYKNYTKKTTINYTKLYEIIQKLYEIIQKLHKL